MCMFRHFKILKGTAQISERCTVFSKLWEWLRITGCYIWSLLSSVHMLPIECNQNEKQIGCTKNVNVSSFPLSELFQSLWGDKKAIFHLRQMEIQKSYLEDISTNWFHWDKIYKPIKTSFWFQLSSDAADLLKIRNPKYSRVYKMHQNHWWSW